MMLLVQGHPEVEKYNERNAETFSELAEYIEDKKPSFLH